MENYKKITFIFLLISLFAFQQVSYAEPVLPVPVGKVVWIEGSLKATMPNNEQRLLQKDSLIYLHDTLMTDNISKAQIVFTDNTLLTFRPSTRLYVSEYLYKPAKKGSVGKYVMNLLEGGFRTITGLIAKQNPSDYQVKTPVATIGVRGTDFSVYYDGKKLWLGNYEGQPCATGKKTVCLDEKNKYAMVNEDGSPEILDKKPAVFSEKETIVPAKMAPFNTGTTQREGGTPRGPVSSFCIS